MLDTIDALIAYDRLSEADATDHVKVEAANRRKSAGVMILPSTTRGE